MIVVNRCHDRITWPMWKPPVPKNAGSVYGLFWSQSVPARPMKLSISPTVTISCTTRA